MRHESFYCSISHSNRYLETRFQEQTYISLGLRTIAQFPIHRILGAVAGLTGDMDGACAFFMPILTVHPLEIVKAIKRQHMSEHYYYGMAAVLLTTCLAFTRTFKH